MGFSQQAYSPLELHTMATDFTAKSAAEFLEPDDLLNHTERMACFHVKLSELDHNVFYIQNLLEFPFDLFAMPGNDLFLSDCHAQYHWRSGVDREAAAEISAGTNEC
jgi:hypothetical protein